LAIHLHRPSICTRSPSGLNALKNRDPKLQIVTQRGNAPTQMICSEALGLAEQLLNDGKFGFSATIATQIAQQLPNSTQAHALAARAYFANGNGQAATNHIDAAIRSAPQNIGLLVLGTQITYEHGNAKPALQYIDKAIALQPRHTELHGIKATVLTALGDLAGAQQ
jgi:predicted Zn-dependent protease